MTFYKIVDSEFQSTTLYRVYANSTDKLSGQILRSKIGMKHLTHNGSKKLSLREKNCIKTFLIHIGIILGI
jgi:hypothetical protein